VLAAFGAKGYNSVSVQAGSLVAMVDVLVHSCQGQCMSYSAGFQSSTTDPGRARTTFVEWLRIAAVNTTEEPVTYINTPAEVDATDFSV
jgi:hypothetical protein